MDLHGGTPYWLLRGGLRSIAPALDCDLECDVAIIGTGITGAMLASLLAKQGMNVVVLDRRDLGTGSTLASTALLMYELDVPLCKLESKIGQSQARTAYNLGLVAIDAIRRFCHTAKVPFTRVPSVYFATSQRTQAQLNQECAARRSAGFAVRLLSSRQVASKWGIAARGAIESQDAAIIDPYQLTHALLREAVNKNARVFDRTFVTHCQTHADSITLKTSGRHTVKAQYVVHATGYEAASRLPRGLVDLSSSFAVVSEPLNSSLKPAVMWQRADPYFYARYVDNRLLVGGEDELFVDATRRDAMISRKALCLSRKVRTLFPHIPFVPAFAWAGTFGSSSDGLGYVGPVPGKDREFYALGFGGNGITFGALGAMMIADMLVGTSFTSLQQRKLLSFERNWAAQSPTRQSAS